VKGNKFQGCVEIPFSAVDKTEKSDLSFKFYLDRHKAYFAALKRVFRKMVYKA
jgi:hypothetical protein